MCDPVTLTAASLAIASASTVAGLAGQAQQYNQNARNAKSAFDIQNNQTNLNIQQNDAAGSVKVQQSQADMLRAAATAKASAGEMGTSGNSVDALLGSYYSAEGNLRNNVTTQGDWNRQQAGMEKQGQAAQAQQRIDSVAKPDFLGAALRISATALDKYTNFKKDNKDNTN